MESLYRSAGGDILRIPEWMPQASGYPDAGDLWRGNEICCPSWEIGYYCQYLPRAYGVKSSIYTPRYLTVTDISGIVDCPGCDEDAEELNNIGGATKVLLTQLSAGVPCQWNGHYIGAQDWTFYLALAGPPAGFKTNLNVFGEGFPSGYGFQYTSGNYENLRLGGTWNSKFLVGGCCANQQVAHSGQLTFVPGDTT